MKKQKDQQNTAKTIGSNKPKSILLKGLSYFFKSHLLTQEKTHPILEKVQLSRFRFIFPCNFNYNIKSCLFQICGISTIDLRCLTLKRAYAYGMR